MKNMIKLSALAAVATIFVTTTAISALPEPKSEAETLTDYLNEQNVSHLMVNNDRLTTFGWLTAKKGCEDIKNAGFIIATVRNIDAETRVETFTVCSE